jgi:hypothetical protein
MKVSPVFLTHAKQTFSGEIKALGLQLEDSIIMHHSPTRLLLPAVVVLC